MKIITLEQKSKPWLDWRSQGIGGSDVAAIMGLSPYATREQLLQEKLGFAKREENYKMRRGDAMEATARILAEKHLQMSLFPACAEHDEIPWARCSFDGINRTRRTLVEIKAPNKITHEKALDWKLLEPYYRVQCQYQMFVANYESCFYCSLSANDIFSEAEKFVMFGVQEDAEEQAAIIEACESFWAELQEARSGKTVLVGGEE